MTNSDGCHTCLHQKRSAEQCILLGCSAGNYSLWAPKERVEPETPKGQPDAQGYIWGCGHDCRDNSCTGCKVTGYASPPKTYAASMPENPKAIHGRAKPDLSLLPGGAEVPIAQVFALGRDKYGPFNWRKDPVEAATYVAAARRHLAMWFDGEDIDEESAQPHLAHAACCMMILLDAMSVGKLIDNRPHKANTADLIRAHTKPTA